MAPRWRGDLHHFSVRTWTEDSDVAALVVVQGAEARGWVNLRHVHPGGQERLVWLWMRHAAYFRGPLDVLYTDDIAALRSGGDQQAQEA